MKSQMPRVIALAVASSLLVAACGESAVQPPAEQPVATSDGTGEAEAVPVANQFKQLTDAELLAPMKPNADGCNIEAIDFVSFEPKVFELERKEAVVSGWLLPAAGAEDAATARLRLTRADGMKGWEIPLARRAGREDVVASRGGKPSDMPGFNQPVDFAKLEPGSYRMVLVFNAGGTGQVCDNGREISLK